MRRYAVLKLCMFYNIMYRTIGESKALVVVWKMLDWRSEWFAEWLAEWLAGTETTLMKIFPLNFFLHLIFNSVFSLLVKSWRHFWGSALIKHANNIVIVYFLPAKNRTAFLNLRKRKLRNHTFESYDFKN
jgi:hypothetical protein